MGQSYVFSFSVDDHFASVESHILSDIHNYHVVKEEDEGGEGKDQWVMERFRPVQESWARERERNSKGELERREGEGWREEGESINSYLRT